MNGNGKFFGDVCEWLFGNFPVDEHPMETRCGFNDDMSHNKKITC